MQRHALGTALVAHDEDVSTGDEPDSSEQPIVPESAHSSAGPGADWMRRFGVALLAVIAALAVRLSLTPLLGSASPFLLFVPAVMLAAFYGGTWPALFATALSSILASRYVGSPPHVPLLERIDRVALFLVVCGLITWVQVRVVAAGERVKESLARERAARREAQAANRSKDDFLAMVSHELRTPLHAVRGWTSLLRKGDLEVDVVRRGLEVIERNVALQARLIDDIVDSVRAAKGTMRLRRQRVDLASVVTAAVDAARPAAASKDVELHQDIDAIGSPVFADVERLQQVMTNLISNALKFTPSGGSVHVQLQRAGDRARITVTDTGMGIDPDFLPFVFEPFKRGNHAREGLGLGLSIARHLVQMHGGHIEVASPGPERGTTFTVTVPLLHGEDADWRTARGAELTAHGPL